MLFLHLVAENCCKTAGTISHKDALEKAKSEYRKYQEQTLSPVEEAYLETIKGLERPRRDSRRKRMKFKFTIQPYQTEAVDVEIERDITNWMVSDEDLYMGFANNQIRLDYRQILSNVNRIQVRNNIALAQSLASGGLGACSLTWKWRPVRVKLMYTSKPCSN